ncbi:universal stress protein [Burkholderiaceae bacterium DAT-1]|nr:universal stress protein [Burkholderiaceae bacterium DAT-1]
MYTNIVLAFDGSHEGRHALNEGAALCKQMNAHVHLVLVRVPSTSVALAEGAYPTEDLEVHEQALAQKSLNEGIISLSEMGIAARPHLLQGQPAAEIVRIAKEVGADLIVLGHREQTRLSRWWNGSVGQSLLSLAPCSVLICVG